MYILFASFSFDDNFYIERLNGNFHLTNVNDGGGWETGVLEAVKGNTKLFWK